MQKLSLASLFIWIIITACNSGGGKDRVKEPEAAVAQTVKNDTVITVYEGVRPCKGCKAINTEIIFTRRLEDTVGRFHLNEVYIDKKDSAFQHYQGVGNYKIQPAANGEVTGVAFYNMILDDQTRSYMYLLEDSVTLQRVDEKGKPISGDDAVILKRSNK